MVRMKKRKILAECIFAATPLGSVCVRSTPFPRRERALEAKFAPITHHSQFETRLVQKGTIVKADRGSDENWSRF